MLDNPFEQGMFEEGDDVAVDEYAGLRDNLVALPAAIELPPGYESVSQLRDAMERAWGLTWVSVSKDGYLARLPSEFGYRHTDDGSLEIYGHGALRAVRRSGEDAPLRLITRYGLESRFGDDDRCQIRVRDRELERTVRESFWEASSGPQHPAWKGLSDWLDREYASHRDPFAYWEL